MLGEQKRTGSLEPVLPFSYYKRLPYLTGKTRYNVVLRIIGIHRTSLLLLIVTAFQIDLYSHVSFVLRCEGTVPERNMQEIFHFFAKNVTTFAP